MHFRQTEKQRHNTLDGFDTKKGQIVLPERRSLEELVLRSKPGGSSCIEECKAKELRSILGIVLIKDPAKLAAKNDAAEIMPEEVMNFGIGAAHSGHEHDFQCCRLFAKFGCKEIKSEEGNATKVLARKH